MSASSTCLYICLYLSRYLPNCICLSSISYLSLRTGNCLSVCLTLEYCRREALGRARSIITISMGGAHKQSLSRNPPHPSQSSGRRGGATGRWPSREFPVLTVCLFRDLYCC